MEHSYTRDWQLKENTEVMATRTILIDRPPQCPSCHLTPNDEKLEAPETYSPPVPNYNEEAGRNAMDETERIVRNSSNKNNRSDDEEWEARISKLGWTEQHHNLFRRVERLLDLDQMARLAVKDMPNECLRRRGIIEKSVSRMRQALASMQWQPRLTQWLHGLLSNHLPPSYTVSYIEILQSLRRKQPMLVDKMLHGRAIDQDYMSVVTKRPWEPVITPKEPKDRRLPGQAVIVIVSASPTPTSVSPRMHRWHQMLETLATVVPIQINLSQATIQKQSFEQITEQIVAMSRAKVQELRNEAPNRPIVLAGFNAGAALAIQVAVVESVSSIVCIGFSYNTMKGVRGAPDDKILTLTTPVLFILGQIAQRSSQEEIESLREKMSAQTSLVVVGGADDSLRINKLNRQMEGVTQSMIDNMIVDEIQEFSSTCIMNPPGPRQPTLNNHIYDNSRSSNIMQNSNVPPLAKKSRLSEPADLTKSGKTIKVGRPRINRTIHPSPKPKNPKKLLNTSNEALQMAIDSILPPTNNDDNIPPLRPISNVADGAEVISTFEVVSSGTGQSNIQTLKPINSKIVSVPSTGKAQISSPSVNLTQKVKFVSSNQFVHIKPPPLNTKKIYMKTPKSTTNPQQSITFRVAPSNDGKAPTGNRLITVKGKSVGQQILTATSFDNRLVQPQLRAPGSAPAIVTGSPNQKFTIVKQTTSPVTSQAIPTQTQTVVSPPTIVKLQTPVVSVSTATTASLAHTSTNSDSDLLNTSILDIPILFADSDGNIEDTQQVTGETKEATFATQSPATNYIVIASQPSGIKSGVISNRSVVVNSLTPTHALTKVSSAQQNSKFVVINRGNLTQLKPGTTNMVTANRTMQPIKYSKVMIPSSDVTTTTTPKTLVTTAGTLTPGTKIDISNLVKTGTVTTRGPAGVATGTTSTKPIIINIDSEKGTFKNVIKIPSSEASQLKTGIASSNNIVFKQGELRTVATVGTIGTVNTVSNVGGISSVSGISGISAMPVIKGGILNRNITVRKINIIRQPSVTTTTSMTTATSTMPNKIDLDNSGNITRQE